MGLILILFACIGRLLQGTKTLWLSLSCQISLSNIDSRNFRLVCKVSVHVNLSRFSELFLEVSIFYSFVYRYRCPSMDDFVI